MQRWRILVPNDAKWIHMFTELQAWGAPAKGAGNAAFSTPKPNDWGRGQTCKPMKQWRFIEAMACPVWGGGCPPVHRTDSRCCIAEAAREWAVHCHRKRAICAQGAAIYVSQCFVTCLFRWIQKTRISLGFGWQRSFSSQNMLFWVAARGRTRKSSRPGDPSHNKTTAAELDPFTSSGRLLQVLSYLLWYFCLINLASIGQFLMRCLSRAFVSGSTTSPLKRGPPLAWQCFDTWKHFSDVYSMVKIIWTLQRCQMEEGQCLREDMNDFQLQLGAVSRLKKRITKPCPMYTCT